MSLFQSSTAIFYVILFVLNVCSFTFAANKEITGVTSVTKDTSCYHYITSALLLLDDMDYIDGGPQKTRVKRNGDGKFADSAKMRPIKVLQLFLTMFNNLFSSDAIGGVHPLSRSVPGAVTRLVKQKIYATLFPDLNKDH